MAVATAPKKKPYPGQKRPIPTKVVGNTFVPNGQAILAAAEKHNIRILHLEREPDNIHDPDAIKVLAYVRNDAGEIVDKVKFGYISNSERACVGCGNMIDGETFSRARTAKCPNCRTIVQYAKGGEITCDSCGANFRTDEHKTVVCPVCTETEWVRDGLASQLARAMDAGVEYVVRVIEYTGGDLNEKTNKVKNRGCNIEISMLEKDKEV